MKPDTAGNTPEMRSLAWKVVTKICHEPSRKFEPLIDEVADLLSSELRVAAPSQEAHGSWPLGVHRAFVAGADWWQWHANKATMFASERDEAEAEAVRKFGPVVAEPSASQEAPPPKVGARLYVCQDCDWQSEDETSMHGHSSEAGHCFRVYPVAEPAPSPATFTISQMKALLEIRNALVNDDPTEAYRLLYELADRGRNSLTPWDEWESTMGQFADAPSPATKDTPLNE